VSLFNSDTPLAQAAPFFNFDFFFFLFLSYNKYAVKTHSTGSPPSLRVLFPVPGFTREVGGRRKPGLYPTSTRIQQRKLPIWGMRPVSRVRSMCRILLMFTLLIPSVSIYSSFRCFGWSFLYVGNPCSMPEKLVDLPTHLVFVSRRTARLSELQIPSRFHPLWVFFLLKLCILLIFTDLMHIHSTGQVLALSPFLVNSRLGPFILFLTCIFCFRWNSMLCHPKKLVRRDYKWHPPGLQQVQIKS
jgi:hypothetical protein